MGLRLAGCVWFCEAAEHASGPTERKSGKESDWETCERVDGDKGEKVRASFNLGQASASGPSESVTDSSEKRAEITEGASGEGKALEKPALFLSPPPRRDDEILL